MSKKYESASVSEVEEHISIKYEIKKRLGKGVSDFFCLLIHTFCILFVASLHHVPVYIAALNFNLKRNSCNYPDLRSSVNTSVVSTGFIYSGRTNSLQIS